MENQPEPEPEFWQESDHNIKNSSYTSKNCFLIWSLVLPWNEPKLLEPHQEPFIFPLYFSEIESECKQLATIIPLLEYHKQHLCHNDTAIIENKRMLNELYFSKSTCLAIRNTIDHISFIQEIRTTMNIIKSYTSILKQHKQRQKNHTDIYNKLLRDAKFILDILGLTNKHISIEQNIKRITWKYNKYLHEKSLEVL